MTLPAGFKEHCPQCGLVIPADSPTLPTSGCMDVVRAKLSWFDPSESTAAQFAMAAGTWSLIHWSELRSPGVHPDALEYSHRVHVDRKAIYAQSAARLSMTPEQVTAEAAHASHAWLHREG